LGGTFQIGYLKKGLNPPSVTSLLFSPPYMMLALKTGIITSIIALAVSLPSMPRQFAYIGWSMTRRTSLICWYCQMQEGIAVGRSFAMLKNYNIDGNKEMTAIGTMNILGSFTSCYLTTGTIPF
jgi:sulfate transporter 3